MLMPTLSRRAQAEKEGRGVTGHLMKSPYVLTHLNRT